MQIKWMVPLLVALVEGCTTLPFQADKVNVSLSDVHITQVGVIEQTYALTLRIQNPNAKPLTIQGLSYNVEINGRNFARGVNPVSLTIAAFGETQIEVSAVSSISSLIEHIVRMKQEKPKTFRYRLTGDLNVPGTIRIGIPFEYAGEIAFSALAPSNDGLDQPVSK